MLKICIIFNKCPFDIGIMIVSKNYSLMLGSDSQEANTTTQDQTQTNPSMILYTIY